jgi:hypothetical protein
MGGNQMKHFLSERNFLNNSIIMIMIIIQHRAYIVVIKLTHTKRKRVKLVMRRRRRRRRRKMPRSFFRFRPFLGQQDTCVMAIHTRGQSNNFLNKTNDSEITAVMVKGLVETSPLLRIAK